MKLNDLKVAAYLLAGSADHPVELCRVAQLDGPDRWAIRQGRFCFSRYGEWGFEPTPSSRTDEFFERFRFATAEEALDCWEKMQGTPRIQY